MGSGWEEAGVEGAVLRARRWCAAIGLHGHVCEMRWRAINSNFCSPGLSHKGEDREAGVREDKSRRVAARVCPMRPVLQHATPTCTCLLTSIQGNNMERHHDANMCIVAARIEPGLCHEDFDATRCSQPVAWILFTTAMLYNFEYFDMSVLDARKLAPNGNRMYRYFIIRKCLSSAEPIQSEPDALRPLDVWHM